MVETVYWSEGAWSEGAWSEDDLMQFKSGLNWRSRYQTSLIIPELANPQRTKNK
ncbi:MULTISPECIES: hypothetical protein [Planktothricoides]|uniref:Uncharacterized protein n=1 Tax=Planktothricoides raciborskii FACHB-1370 TaxID=2949576 RepID=A0ABR8EM20_9CYAN|nr:MULTISPECIES: hypothetical protein [Planktothricoides]MBD2546945.1 hypothetical protein [Planktothricoides raciborskii FACHB-1370]MBD2585872.1 hypothetical protein [Planktothricoides raciborskii FACHB-1261]